MLGDKLVDAVCNAHDNHRCANGVIGEAFDCVCECMPRLLGETIKLVYDQDREGSCGHRRKYAPDRVGCDWVIAEQRTSGVGRLAFQTREPNVSICSSEFDAV